MPQRYKHRGVEARKEEKTIVNELSQLERGGRPVLDRLYIPITDPEQGWLRIYGLAFTKLKAWKKRKKEPVLTPCIPGNNIVVDNSKLCGNNTEVDLVSRESHVIDQDLQADFLFFPDFNLADADAGAASNFEEIQFRLKSSDTPEAEEEGSCTGSSSYNTDNLDNE